MDTSNQLLHDIRNQLNVICLANGLMKRLARKGNIEALERHMQVIDTACTLCNQLIAESREKARLQESQPER